MPVVGRYDYTDADGNLLYWKERIEPGRDGQKKEFRFYHGNKSLGRGGNPVLYNLPMVLKSKSVIITEGEKQANKLISWGLCGTSLDSGSGSKMTESMKLSLSHRRVCMLRDNDEAGQRYASTIVIALHGITERLTVVLLPRLPEKGDLMDWDGKKEELLQIIRNSPEADPPKKVEILKPERKSIFTGTDITLEMIEQAANFPIGKLIKFDGNKTCCISHEEKTPSMIYYPDKNRVHCYGCGFHGNPIDVMIKKFNMRFKEAVEYLINN